MKSKFKSLFMCTAMITVLALCGCTAGTAGTAGTAASSEPVIADGLVEFTVDGETELDGNFYLSFIYSRNLVMLDGKGNTVWSKHEEQPTDGARTGFWDFKKHIVDGRTYYSYHDNTGTYDNYGLTGYAPGERVILDENFNEIKRITFEKSDVTEKGFPVDGHDFLMIDLDHYILSGYVKGTVTNNPDFPGGSSVVYSYLQEVNNGEVVWDFASIDYPELYALTTTDASDTANDFANLSTDAPDYVHFNSMAIDDSGDLVCSFRHINSVISLDRTTDTDQINWILSGAGDQFGLTEAQKTSCQHYATIDGAYITAFDNGNKNKSTRLVSYSIDEENKKLNAFKEYSLGGKYSSACGSAQHIKDEIYVIGWGLSRNDKQCMTVYDFLGGKELMTVTLEDIKENTYRCVYCD